MAKKAATSAKSSSETNASAPKRKAAAAPKGRKHLKAQAAGAVAAVETFVTNLVHPHVDAETPVVAAKPTQPEKDVLEAPIAEQEAEPVPVPETKPEAPATLHKHAKAEEKAVSEQEIARVAFCYYMDRGGTNGTALDDWFRAERALKGGAR